MEENYPGTERTRLYKLQVDFVVQRRGIGKRLLQALFELAQELGCAEAWVLTERDNAAALRLYTSLGGVEEPDEPVMFTFQLG